MKPAAIICDLDGTLCNIEHRRHFIEETPKRWEEFCDGITNDSMNLNVWLVLLSYYKHGYQPLFVTGRMEKYRGLTREWLERNLGSKLATNPLFMRSNSDFREDAVVKKELYESYIDNNYKIWLVLEDRDGPVSMWREIGLECWQVANGDF